MTFERHYARSRPLLSPAMMSRVGGGFQAHPSNPSDETKGLVVIADRLSFDNAEAHAALKQCETELSKVTAGVQLLAWRLCALEDLESQQLELLQNAQYLLQQAMERLQAEQQTVMLTRADLHRTRQVAAKELHGIHAYAMEWKAEACALKQQLEVLLARKGEKLEASPRTAEPDSACVLALAYTW